MEARATYRFIPSSPRKMRLVVDLVRGMNAVKAMESLQFQPKHASNDALKVIKSAVSNLINNNEESRTVVDPELPEGKAEEIRKDAVAIFKALDCSGLSRVDFFLTKDTNEVVFNEINTLPGFTAISMYPMLWEARGLSKKALVQKLIDLAMNRYDV